MAKQTPPLPLPVQRALRKLGKDLHEARKRRRLTTTVMADRVQVSRPTLQKMEQGDASVSIATYANALYVLGLVDRLAELADLSFDDLGKKLSNENLPERIRSR